jgi:hypothetical protein
VMRVGHKGTTQFLLAHASATSVEGEWRRSRPPIRI